MSKKPLARRIRRRIERSWIDVKVATVAAKKRGFRRKKPVIGLVGFFGWGNYGDELF
ncbi:MAG: hypothetical protein RL745_1003, partial [Actinomycetota bacterium]